MTSRKRQSHRSGRAPLPSPGRPPEAKRSELQRFWLGIARGMASENAALAAGISQPVGARLFRKAAGMPPSMFRSSAKPPCGRYLSFAERERSHSFTFRAFRCATAGAFPSDGSRPDSKPAASSSGSLGSGHSIEHRRRTDSAAGIHSSATVGEPHASLRGGNFHGHLERRIPGRQIGDLRVAQPLRDD